MCVHGTFLKQWSCAKQFPNRLRENKALLYRIADVNGDGLDDFVCKDTDPTAQIKVIKNQNPMYFDKNSSTYVTTFCQNSQQKNFYTSRFGRDGTKADLLCLNEIGSIQVE